MDVLVDIANVVAASSLTVLSWVLFRKHRGITPAAVQKAPERRSEAVSRPSEHVLSPRVHHTYPEAWVCSCGKKGGWQNEAKNHLRHVQKITELNS